MKKSQLVLLTLVPIVVGWLINAAIIIPVIGSLMFYVLPYAVLVFWFWLGKQYAKCDWNFLISIVVSSATGIISLVLYIWQFLFETDETRSLFIAGLSQMYCASTPSHLFGRLANLFESQPHYIGRASFLALQVISVVLMLVIFICGYIKGRKEYKKSV